MNSIKLWVTSMFLNVLAFIDPKTINAVLGGISTMVVIAYHIIKIRQELKAKK